MDYKMVKIKKKFPNRLNGLRNIIRNLKIKVQHFLNIFQLLRYLPSCSVVGVLTAGLQVEVAEAPVFQFLTKVLNTNLFKGFIRFNVLG